MVVERTQNKHILVVDDQPEILSAVNKILHGLYNVRVAKNTLKAFGTLHDEHIDLILLDINMPGMNGLEFLNYVRVHKYYADEPVHVIMMTAEADRGHIEQATALGVDGYIRKPIHPELLKEKIAAVFAGAGNA